MMKKSMILGIATALSLTAVCATLVLRRGFDTLVLSEPTEYSMTLNGSTAMEEKDDGYLHQAKVKNNLFDAIGFDEVEGKFGSIKEKTYGEGGDALTYKGMIYNRSLINGINSLTVTFSGEDLYCVFTEFLMEDMTFLNGTKLVSGEELAAPAGKGYFVVYTGGDEAATIDSLTVAYKCDASLSDTIVLGKTSTLGGARSIAKHYERLDSHIEMENNPLRTTNNYSIGNDGKHDYTWYRWNGQYLANSEGLGTEFSLHMTIMGNTSQMIDPSSYFNYSIWPEFQVVGKPERGSNWVQVYIGNDNYEPLGKDDPARVHKDGYGNYSYAGRFFGTYRNFGDDEHPNWQFADPDLFDTLDASGITLREAYEAFTLPFWHVEFKVYVAFDDEEGEDWIMCDSFINGFKVCTDWLFAADGVGSLSIKTLHMHLVNYGEPEETVVEGNPVHEGKPSYTGAFTYPRLPLE